jgi:hypothetical protein
MLGYLRQENVEPMALRLSVAGEVPEDASALAIIGPQYDFTLDEIGILENYWEAGGRLLILLDPHSDTPNMRDFIRRRAVDPRDDRVLRSIRLTSDLVGIQPAVVAQFVRDSAITRGLEGANTILKGGTSSLGMDGTMADEVGLSLGGLMFAEEGYWGEVDHQAQEKYFNEGVDNEFPLPLAVSVEALNTAERDHRMIVIGNSEFLSNTNLKDASRDFALNSVNWLLDRDFLIEIPPRERDLSMLQLTPEQKRQILFYCVVLVPGIAAGVGLIIWLKRRR